MEAKKLFSPISVPSFFKSASLLWRPLHSAYALGLDPDEFRGVGPGCSPSPPMVHDSPTEAGAVLICSAGLELQLALLDIHFPAAAM